MMNLYRRPPPAKEKLPFGCPVLDCFLHGGINRKEVTEISGESSAGKTQLCLQLLLNTTGAEEKARAAYFYTEGEPPVERMREMLQYRDHQGGAPGQEQSQRSDYNDLERIYIEHGFSCGDELIERLRRLEKMIQTCRKNSPVKILIVDSIAWLFRDLGDSSTPAEELAARSSFFFKISSILRKYADEYDMAVVVTNHAVDHVDGTPNLDSCQDYQMIELNPGCGGLTLSSSGRQMYPALGLSWSNCITTRIFVYKESRVDKFGEPCQVFYFGSNATEKNTALSSVKLQVRGMKVVFSPSLPQSTCYFIVRASGPRGIDPRSV